MTPRSSAAILMDIEDVKVCFDRRYMAGGWCPASEKVDLQPEWERMLKAVARLFREVRRAEVYEARKRDGYRMAHGKAKCRYYMNAGKAGQGHE